MIQFDDPVSAINELSDLFQEFTKESNLNYNFDYSVESISLLDQARKEIWGDEELENNLNFGL